MRTGRAWLGVLGVAAGSFLLFSPGERADELITALQVSWPYVLIGLAGFNVLVSLLKHGRWIAPALLALSGAAGILYQRTDAQVPVDAVRDAALAALILVGATVAVGASATGGNRLSAIALSRSVALDRDIADALRVRAVLAEISVDLSQSTWSGRRIIHTSAIAGRVQVTVPRNAPVLIVDGGVGVALGDTGLPRRATAPAQNAVITLHLGGLLGRVDIVRL